MAIFVEMNGGKFGVYPCECGEGGMVVKCFQDKGKPQSTFVVELSHENEDGSTSKHSVELSPVEFANVIMDFSSIFYGSNN